MVLVGDDGHNVIQVRQTSGNESYTANGCAVLIAHAGGPRQIGSSENETHALKALRARRLIYFNRLNRPTHTIITVRGRELIAALLRHRRCLGGENERVRRVRTHHRIIDVRFRALRAPLIFGGQYWDAV
jgi:hypothetical protein